MNCQVGECDRAHSIFQQAALAFDMMIKAAKAKKIKFKNIGDYRSLADQEKLFFER